MLLSEVFDYSADTMALRGYWNGRGEFPERSLGPVCMVLAIISTCPPNLVRPVAFAARTLGNTPLAEFNDKADQDACIAKFRELAQQCRNEGL